MTRKDQRTGRFTAERTTETTLEPGGTPWAGGHPVRWQPPDGLTVLDRGFPIRHVLPPSAFWEMARLRPDRPALAGLTARARAAEAVQQETFVVPVGDTMPIPVVRVGRVYPELAETALAHEFTDADRAALVAALGPGEVIA